MVSVYMVEVNVTLGNRDCVVPLCCNLSAGPGSEGRREESQQEAEEEVEGALTLGRTTISKMKLVQQQQREEE